MISSCCDLGASGRRFFLLLPSPSLPLSSLFSFFFYGKHHAHRFFLFFFYALLGMNAALRWPLQWPVHTRLRDSEGGDREISPSRSLLLGLQTTCVYCKIDGANLQPLKDCTHTHQSIMVQVLVDSEATDLTWLLALVQTVISRQPHPS